MKRDYIRVRCLFFNAYRLFPIKLIKPELIMQQFLIYVRRVFLYTKFLDNFIIAKKNKVLEFVIK